MSPPTRVAPARGGATLALYPARSGRGRLWGALGLAVVLLGLAGWVARQRTGAKEATAPPA